MKFAWIALAILGFASGAPSGVRMEQLQDAKVRASDSRWQLHLFQAFDHITRQVKWHTFKEVFDITNEEFWGTRSCLHRKEPSLDCTLCSSYLRLNLANELPPSVDWRQKGYVTDVKNQETCGSCWAFSSTGSLEGQYFRKTGNLVSMSEQNLVDCSRDCNDGCSGGWMDYAFDYVKRNGGIDSEASYPYTGEFGQCEYTESGEVTSVTGCMAVPSGDESALQEAVATVGPVSVAIDANHTSFQFYSQGVYEEDQCSTIKLNHAVLVVGYGQLQDVDYWIVKNSWGTSWGDEGYILMSRNKDNMCGIASHAVYPLL